MVECGKLKDFQKECPTTKSSSPSYPSSSKFQNKTKFQTNPSSSSHHHNQIVDHDQKDYKVMYKALKFELALLTQKIEDEGTTTIKSFMAIDKEEPVMENIHAMSGRRGKRKDPNSSKYVVFIKVEDSLIENSPESTSNESMNDNQEP
nr:hypothetical protein [Tanacetum cinerariifolium]